MITIVAWLCGCLVGAIAVVTVQDAQRRMARTRAQIAKLDREIQALRAGPPTEVTLGYAVRRDGPDMVLEWKRPDGSVIESYYMTDQAAAQLVSSIVAKFEA